MTAPNPGIRWDGGKEPGKFKSMVSLVLPSRKKDCVSKDGFMILVKSSSFLRLNFRISKIKLSKSRDFQTRFYVEKVIQGFAGDLEIQPMEIWDPNPYFNQNSSDFIYFRFLAS